MQSSARQAALDYWMGWIADSMDLPESYSAFSYLPNSKGQILLTAKRCSPRREGSDFEVLEGECLRYLITCSCEEGFPLWNSRVSTSVSHDVGNKVRLPKSLEVEDVEILQFSEFKCHEYFRHAGAS